MGQKANPIGLRLGILNSWDLTWYAPKGLYAKQLHQDLKIKDYIKKELGHAGISKVMIERIAKKIRVTIRAARPGVIIGSKGRDIGRIKSVAEEITGNEVLINVIEVKKAEVDAVLIASNLAQQLEKRVSFRKAAKRVISTVMRSASGIKIKIRGRINGAEIARSLCYSDGIVPLHTLRALIDYGTARANTSYGVIGVKVWVCRGKKSNTSFEE